MYANPVAYAVAGGPVGLLAGLCIGAMVLAWLTLKYTVLATVWMLKYTVLATVWMLSITLYYLPLWTSRGYRAARSTITTWQSRR
jgi:hypothetical protein